MTRSNRSLQVEINWIFWRVFWLVFMVCQFALWHHLRRRLPRGMGQRNFVMHMVIPSALSSLFVATLVAAGLTFLAFLVIKLVLGPLLSSWLTPTVDPTAVLFHLAPGEGEPGQHGGPPPIGLELAGWSTRGDRSANLVSPDGVEPRALVGQPQRNRRLRSRAACTCHAGSDPQLAGPARLEMRDGCQSTFAVADPRSLVAWLKPGRQAESVAFPFRNLGQGVFDV